MQRLTLRCRSDDVEQYFNYMGCLAVEGTYDRMYALLDGAPPAFSRRAMDPRFSRGMRRADSRVIRAARSRHSGDRHHLALCRG